VILLQRGQIFQVRNLIIQYSFW